VHVAIVTTSYPNNIPGSEAAGSFVADFAQQLTKHAQVTVIAAGSAASRSRDGNLDVLRFAVPRSPLSLLRPLHPADWPAIVRTIQNGKRAVQRFVKDAQPDYLFALWALPSGHWAASIGRQYNIPFGIWALGSDIWSLGRIPLLRGKLRFILRAADHCFADGLKLAEDVARLSGRHCEFLASTRVLLQPDDDSKTACAPYKLAFLGRWHMNKGVDLLLDALRQFSDQDWSRITAVRICGGGPLHEEVHRGVAELRKRNRPVEVGGYLGKQDAADLITWADYLLLPSRIESIPVIFSDAVQLRTPVVATPVGDLPALHHKYKFGTLAAAPTPDAFARALRQALDENAMDFRAGLTAAATVFDIADTAQHFVDEIAGSVS